jgi:hypothetical protein
MNQSLRPSGFAPAFGRAVCALRRGFFVGLKPHANPEGKSKGKDNGNDNDNGNDKDNDKDNGKGNSKDNGNGGRDPSAALWDDSKKSQGKSKLQIPHSTSLRAGSAGMTTRKAKATATADSLLGDWSLVGGGAGWGSPVFGLQRFGTLYRPEQAV